VEVAAQNITNMTTPGYKRAVSFESLVAAPDGTSTGLAMAIDLAQGQQQTTGNPNDLAISGTGFFSVRTKDGAVLYTREGQLQRDGEGHLVTAQGAVLQQRGGGDLELKTGDFKVLNDGTVTQGGEPVGQIGLVKLADPTAMRLVEGGLYSAPDASVSEMDAANVRQGALEASNVNMGPEMMTMMAALRQAQSGQQLMNTYDDLMGRAISTFGQG
jgi:flagellar basal-body rod protein FlgG